MTTGSTWETVVAATDDKPVAIYRRPKPRYLGRYDWKVATRNSVVTVDSERSARVLHRQISNG